MKGKLSWRGRADELRSLATGAALVVLVVLAITAVAYAFARRMGIPFDDLSRDAASALDGPSYTGYYANLTILWWQVPATASLVASVVLRRAGRRETARMLLTGGLITAVMALDDVFLLHEFASDKLDVPQLVTIGTGWERASCSYRWCWVAGACPPRWTRSFRSGCRSWSRTARSCSAWRSGR